MSQILAWVVASLFVLGFFLPILGAWTGTVMAVWFVSTQRPWRGFLLMVAISSPAGVLRSMSPLFDVASLIPRATNNDL